MLRYYAIATAIVLTVAVLVTLQAGEISLRFRNASASPPPQHLRLNDGGGVSAAPIAGDAPWALSALPDCFHQEVEWSGSATYVDAHLPTTMARVPAGTKLAYGSCTISVGDGELSVRRGDDRFRIPPHATLYRSPDGLALLRSSHHHAVLRTYTITIR